VTNNTQEAFVVNGPDTDSPGSIDLGSRVGLELRLSERRAPPMPLRDHFRPPLSDERSWEGFHGGWPMMIAAALNRRLPRRFVAEPQDYPAATTV
jgi:hypothetical protein